MMKKNFLIAVLGLILMVGFTPLWAHDKKPLLCQPNFIKFTNNNLVLNSSDKTTTHVYVLHNKSQQNFWLGHDGGQMASAGWDSELAPDHWSALLMDQANFNLNCSALTKGKKQTLNCQQLLQVCVLNVSSDLLPQGHYWLTENQTNYKKLHKKIDKRLLEAQYQIKG